MFVVSMSRKSLICRCCRVQMDNVNYIFKSMEKSLGTLTDLYSFGDDTRATGVCHYAYDDLSPLVSVHFLLVFVKIGIKI